MSTGTINAKKLLFDLGERDRLNPELWDKVSLFCEKREVANAMLTRAGNLMLISNRKIGLNSGTLTLQKELQLAEPPVRDASLTPLPHKFLQEFFADGFDPEKIMYRFGSMFEDAALRHMINNMHAKKRTCIRNQALQSMSTMQLVDQGYVSLEKAYHIENNKKIMERLARETELNPDLEDKYVIKFEEWQPSEGNSKVFVRTGRFPPVEVTLEGLPQDTDVKLKHYYIYSKKPGFGKTHAMKAFRKKYNAHFVDDLNNWMSVPRRAQFLIFEEIGHQKKLEFFNLKALTSGTSDGFSGNCKTHGESYTTREDVQIVMLSNMSIYEAYGTWDSKLQRRFIERDRVSQLEQRFHVIRLDGDHLKDRLTCMEPAAWTENQFNEELQNDFAILTSHLREIGDSDIRDAILSCQMYIHRAKLLRDTRLMGLGRPAQMTRSAFIRHLKKLQIDLQPALKVSLEEVVTAFYTDTNEKKTGKEFYSALASLERKNSDPLDLCAPDQPPRVTRRSFTYTVWQGLFQSFLEEKRQYFIPNVDLKALTKDLWQASRNCGVHDWSMFSEMTPLDVVRIVALDKESILGELYRYYCTLVFPATCFTKSAEKEYQEKLQLCLSHHSKNSRVDDLDRDAYEAVVFRPMWNMFVDSLENILEDERRCKRQRIEISGDDCDADSTI